MRLRDENKRKVIVQTAIRLFSEQPFHKVRLDDVAAAAGVGKGTVYIYFKNKEDLYYSMVYDGLADLVERLDLQLKAHTTSFEDRIRVVVSAIVDFSVQHPRLFEVMRTVGVPDATSAWDHKRQELAGLVESVIRQGAQAGECVDRHPEYTGVYITGMVRAVMLYGPKDVDSKALTDHILTLLLKGIGKPGR
jgi:AcrR family transcriptional regulator